MHTERTDAVATMHCPVQFARRLNRDAELSDALRRQQDTFHRVSFVAIFFFTLLLNAGLRALGVVQYRAIVLISAMAVMFIAALCRQSLAEWLFVRRNRNKLPLFAKDGERLVCIGSPRDLAGFGPLDDLSFEPVIFRASFGVLPEGRRGALVVGLGAVAFFGLLLTFKYFYFGDCVRGGPMTDLSASFLFGEAFRAFLWPVYLRVIPGRLDVMIGGPFRRTLEVAKRIDLREANIVINLPRNYAMIHTGYDRHEFSLQLMLERRRFAYSLFLAALSTYEPPALPEDELLG